MVGIAASLGNIERPKIYFFAKYSEESLAGVVFPNVGARLRAPAPLAPIVVRRAPSRHTSFSRDGWITRP
jgi:hypothetical protein